MNLIKIFLTYFHYFTKKNKSFPCFFKFHIEKNYIFAMQGYISKKSVSLHIRNKCGSSSVGRASASQAEGRGFESRFPLEIVD